MSRDLQGALVELDAEAARRRLADFLALLAPNYERPPHARLICEHLEALERREINRLIVSMPPRHGKTLHVSQAFPAWYLGRRPTERVILASYGAELAEGNSRKAREFVSDDRYPFATRVAADSSAVNRWATSSGGIVIATGVGGGLTGHGADLLVVDDPVKDREAADSPAIRESTGRWFNEVAMTRLQPGAVALLTATRWHEDDLTGRVLSGARANEWTVLSLPALAEDVDALGRAEGEALWPDWFDADALAAIRVEIGERAFASLYQQQPTPDKGRIFQRDWLKGRYDKIPDGAHLIQTVDSAFKTGVANDWSVIATWAAAGSGFLLVNIWRQRVEFPDLVKAIKQQAKDHHPTAILIEDTAAGQSAIQVLRRETSLPIVAAPAKGSKVSRADAVSPLFESGRVFLPSPEPAWLPEWIEEHVKFDQGKHDDQVDTTSMALDRLRSGRGGAGIAGVVHHPRPGDRRREFAQQTTDDALREHEAAKERRAARRERERERAAARPLGETDPRFAG